MVAEYCDPRKTAKHSLPAFIVTFLNQLLWTQLQRNQDCEFTLTHNKMETPFEASLVTYECLVKISGLSKKKN